MTYRVELETRARRQFLKLPVEVRERMADAIDDMAREPRCPGVKRLRGSPGYRLRQGDYRLLLTLDDETRLLRIYRIGHRREVYRQR